MELTILTLVLTLAIASANIIFPYIQPTCHYEAVFPGCFRGQECTTNNTCSPMNSISLLEQNAAAPPRSDGRCGYKFDGATCYPHGPFGGCCSQHGWCGTSPLHCLPSLGCQSGCATESPKGFSVSQSWSSVGEATGAALSPVASSTPVTTDGTCGAGNDNTVCGNWPNGPCCSAYGYCGKGTGHCGQGCQSGPCLEAPPIPGPGPSPAPPNPNPGSFEQVGRSGVPAMHAALMPNGRVVFLDKVENYTELKLETGYYAYSSEYDLETNQVVPLAYQTNAFCAGGSFMANGTLLSLGGNAPLSWLDPTVEDGFRSIRYLTRSSTDPSLNGESWHEEADIKLDTKRWYPSAQIMPDGTLFVASGSLNGLDVATTTNNNPTYEILSPDGITQGESVRMSVLVSAEPYYMYPFCHLLADGSLFVFVSRVGEVFDVNKNETVKTFPELPGEYRTYPNTGGSVLLPLSSADNWNPDIVICGGGVVQDVTSATDPSCGRIQPLNDDASWEMDSIPEGRGMVESILLPNGQVLWINGCNQGAQGFNLGRQPTTQVLLYDPTAPHGQRWSTGASSEIPRLYHSVALLLLDGTVMVAGSNPEQMPLLQPIPGHPYTTEFRVEIYTPPYLSGENANRRPTIVQLSTTDLTADSSTFEIRFDAPAEAQEVKIALYHGGFVTHSLHMSHRMMFLDNEGWQAGQEEQTLEVTMPPNNNIAPPGPYVVYVTVDGVPSVGQFVMVG